MVSCWQQLVLREAEFGDNSLASIYITIPVGKFLEKRKRKKLYLNLT